MHRVPDLIAQNVQYLDQALALVGRLDREVWTARGPGFEHGPVGTQVRHVLDHYSCFLAGWVERHVDYDGRARDARIEADPAHAAACLVRIKQGLAGLRGEAGDSELTVTQDDPRDPPARVVTTLARELQVLTSHTIHHFAVIGLILRTLDVPVDRNFGVAPSTLVYCTKVPGVAR